jgi:nucleoside triphosphate pyrophosphatase
LSRLLLASRSPRRKKILALSGLSFRVVPPRGVDEKPRRGESPRALARRLACAKALEVARRHPKDWVVGADTVVGCGGEVLGKPVDRKDAARMMGLLQGRFHEVWTGVALAGKGGRMLRIHAERTVVLFGAVPPGRMLKYLGSREPYDKAGAYAIQGTARAWIRDWTGDFLNVMGLPLDWLLREIQRLPGLFTRPGRS